MVQQHHRPHRVSQQLHLGDARSVQRLQPTTARARVLGLCLRPRLRLRLRLGLNLGLRLGLSLSFSLGLSLGLSVSLGLSQSLGLACSMRSRSAAIQAEAAAQRARWYEIACPPGHEKTRGLMRKGSRPDSRSGSGSASGSG